MKYYDIPDEATWNSVVGSLGEIRIREIVMDLRNIIRTVLKSSEEVSE